MAIFGWSTVRQAEHYTKKAERRRGAGMAMHLLMPDAAALGHLQKANCRTHPAVLSGATNTGTKPLQ